MNKSYIANMMEVITYIALVVLICGTCATVDASVKQWCPKFCVCNSTKLKVICDGREGKPQSVIPRLPANTYILVFRYNRIYSLSRSSFKNVKNSTLQFLKLQYCDIRNIDKDAFVDLTHLEELELTGNTALTPKDISRCLLSLSRSTFKNLSVMYMSTASWENLPDNMFNGLLSTNVRSISIVYSRIKFLNGKIYKDLRSLKYLDLSWNAISNFDCSGLTGLEMLNLNANFMNYVPNFCNSPLSETLKILSLNYGKIQTLKRQIKCLNKLEELSLNGLSLRLLYDNTFADLPLLKTLRLERLGSSLKTIRNNAFNSSTLETLLFSTQNSFTFKTSKHLNPKYIFANCPSLKHLDVSENLMKMSHQDLVDMFSPLKSLRILKMKKMHIQTIPIGLFSLLPALRELYLDDNRISHWNEGIPFENMTSLELMSLKFNRISVINETSFPKELLNGSLKTLMLYGNPFSCNCDLMWFRNWMRSTKVLLINSDKFKCAVSEKLVLNYNPTSDVCSPRNIVIPVVTSISSFLVFLFLISFIIYICRWKIRFHIYKLRNRNREYQSIPGVDDFVYDCYVVYCEDDFLWVKTFLIPNVETQHAYRLCLQDRDFTIGGIIIDQMLSNIRKSRTVILVMSNNFAKDEWCKFQLAVVQDLEIVSGTPVLIPTLLHEIEYKYMNETIYNFISRRGYISWDDSESVQESFWNQIIDLLK